MDRTWDEYQKEMAELRQWNRKLQHERNVAEAERNLYRDRIPQLERVRDRLAFSVIGLFVLFLASVSTVLCLAFGNVALADKLKAAEEEDRILSDEVKDIAKSWKSDRDTLLDALCGE